MSGNHIAFDQPRTLSDLLAEKIARIVLDKIQFYKNFEPALDVDDACHSAGEATKEYLITFVESEDMQKAIRKIVGNSYNEEFFIDGLNNR